MAKFIISFQKTLAHEEGYVNDSDDSGKETYKGISRASHPNWEGWSIIDDFKQKANFSSDLIQNEKLQKLVEQFYLTNFWVPVKGDLISNQSNADSIFDFAVNAGIYKSVYTIQSIIGTKADGTIGEITLKRLNSIDFGYFQPAFTVAKISHYISIIKKRPTNKKYLYGWIIRALTFHD